jgi:hypothetical protein
MRKIKTQACTQEWTPYLDDFLASAIVRNYFNFDLVAVEVNQEHQKRSGASGSVGAVSNSGLFTAEKCRIRWSYIHLKVSSNNKLTSKSAQRRKQKASVRASPREQSA